MDEFRKVFPGYDVESHENLFAVYYEMLMNSGLAGFIVNLESERFFLPKEGFEKNEELPIFEYPADDAYTSEELKRLKDEISNGPLEEFIQNPQNIGRYEELFERISSSTVMTLMLSKNDLSGMVRNGVISMEEPKPLGHLYTQGGEYAAVFTSEEKISNVDTPLNRYSQLVNFSYLVNFILNDDMDGIVINPESDNIVLTRDILLEFAQVLDVICNDPKLNSAMFHMFPMEE